MSKDLCAYCNGENPEVDTVWGKKVHKMCEAAFTQKLDEDAYDSMRGDEQLEERRVNWHDSQWETE